MADDRLEDMAGHPLRRSGDPKSFNDMSVQVGRLEESIQSTNLALRDFAGRTSGDISRLTESIQEINKNQLLGKQTNWGMIASWVGVLVLLLGLVVYQPLQEIRSGIFNHKADGHPHSVLNRIANNEERFVDITSRMQREIELLEEADKARHLANLEQIKHADEWILDHQSISSKKHAILSTKVENLKEDVDRFMPAMGGHEKDIVSLRERILDIEREIYAGATYRSGRPIKPSKQ